jgi:GAF domain-containing protein
MTLTRLSSYIFTFMEITIENKRLENLHKYKILDTPADGQFDEITALAANIFNVPVAIISLVDTDRIWFKSSFGLDVEEIPRDPGLCSSAIMSDDIYIVENARSDPRTLANPLVAGAMGLQFYAAAPLKSADGYNLGTICIIDKTPRKLNARESSMLRQLSRIVMDQFELKLQSRLMVKEIQKNISKQ